MFSYVTHPERQSRVSMISRIKLERKKNTVPSVVESKKGEREEKATIKHTNMICGKTVL